jgi:uncharacterized membrane protein
MRLDDAVLRALCLSLVWAAHASAGGVTPIGDGSGFTWAQVSGLSSDGSRACGHDAYAKGFVWSAGAYTPVPSLPGETVSFVWDLSSDGSVAVGEAWDGSIHQAIRWTAAGGTVPLGTLQPGQAGAARGVSADGSVVVGWSGSKPYRWTAGGGMQPLGNPQFGYAYGVSADGAIAVGTAQFGLHSQAFRWTEATGLAALTTLPGYVSSGAAAISADGSTIVGSTSPPGGDTREPFRWTEAGGMVVLDNPPGCGRGGANWVSGDGALIAGECSVDDGESTTRIPFVWTQETGTLTLQAFLAQRGVALDEPLIEPEIRAVSDDGRVIAVTVSPPAQVGSLLIDVTPVAVPALPPLGALLLAAGLLAAARRRSG